MALGFIETADALRGGDRLMVTRPDPLKPDDRPLYALVSSGRTVNSRAFWNLIKSQNLVAIPDGLFGTDMSQTFAWQEAPELATTP